MNTTDQPLRLLDLTRETLRAQMVAWEQPAFRADQVWHWLYKELVTDASAMTNLPLDLRTRLAQETQIDLLEPVAESRSASGETTKILFRLDDGQLIEAVLMRYHRRRTVCISSQAGCAMGCTFCATAAMGLQRNLTPGEIVAQVLFFERRLRVEGQEGNGLTNVVVMGMGEPLANYDNLWQALRLLTDPQGFGMGARRITVSTVGLVPAIDRFSQEGLQVGLAVSLHAPDDELRSQLVPINQRYPLSEVLAACRRYVQRMGRRVTFEYALMRDINDSREQAEALADLLVGLLCHVNLIPLNPVPGSPYQPARRQDVDRFVQVLESRGIPVTLRVRRGIDIDAGCGQLRARVVERRKATRP